MYTSSLRRMSFFHLPWTWTRLSCRDCITWACTSYRPISSCTSYRPISSFVYVHYNMFHYVTDFTSSEA
uniref:Uncharacterized protein n=1 Tax=Medicago truncatula TaxID=3880 RepID=I3SM94_MEDTR|nr:unknown [Medicago truncatula]